MKIRLALFFAFVSPLAFAQGVWSPPGTALKVVNGLTSPIANATITVCAANAGGIPCTPALTGTIFSNAALTQPLSNPFTADAFGNYQFAAAANTYTVTVTASGFQGQSYQVTLGGSGGGGSPAGAVLLSPTGTQAVVQPMSGGITTPLQINNLENWRVVTPAFNWSFTDSGGSLGNLTVAGAVTITLPCTVPSPCPEGLDLSAHAAYPFAIYISGTGTAEAPVVTGGTCISGATTSCTILVTTANAHPNGYTVGSAYSGVQEAWNDAQPSDSVNQNFPAVKLMSNTDYQIRAPLILHGRGGQLDGAGARFLCFTRSTCVLIGTIGVQSVGYHKLSHLAIVPQTVVEGAQITSVSASSGDHIVTTNTAHNLVAGDTAYINLNNANDSFNGFATVTSVVNSTSFHFAVGGITYASTASFGNVALENAGLEDNADGAVLENSDVYIIDSNHFSFGIINDNDQNFKVDHVTSRGSNVTICDANFCGWFLWSRGDGSQAGIVYLSNSEIALSCHGNGVYIGSGNVSSVTNTVIQAFAQTAIWAPGGLQPETFNNVYEEVGTCSNPYYPGSGTAQQAQLGLNNGGAAFSQGGSVFAGLLPTFNTGTGSGTERNYWVQPHDTVNGFGSAMLAGITSNTGGTVNVSWPMIAGADKYNLYLTTGAVGSNNPAGTIQVGTNNAILLASNILQTSCSLQICQFSDVLPNAGTTTTYTPGNSQLQAGFWPAAVLITGNGVFVGGYVNNGAIPSGGFVATAGMKQPSVFSPYCAGINGWNPIWEVCSGFNAITGAPFQATVFNTTDNAGNSAAAGSSGRISMGRGSSNSDIITLVDSNWQHKLSFPGMRGPWDVGDTAIGQDQVGGVYDRAPTSLSWYLNTVGDNSSYKMRLNSSGLNLFTPFSSNSTVTSTAAGTFNTVNSNGAGVGALSMTQSAPPAQCPTNTPNCLPATGVVGFYGPASGVSTSHFYVLQAAASASPGALYSGGSTTDVNSNVIENVAPFRGLTTTIPSSDTISAAGSFATTLALSNTNSNGIQMLLAGSLITIRAHGIYTTTATASPLVTFQVNAGGTTAACNAPSAITLAISTTNAVWDLVCYIQINTVGAPGTASAWGDYEFANNVNGAEVIGNNRLFPNSATFNYTTNSSQNVTLQETSTLVAGQTFTLQSFTAQVTP